MTSKALVIGASGGIGKAMLALASQKFQHTYAVSRHRIENAPSMTESYQGDTNDEAWIAQLCQDWKSQAFKFDAVFCCVGMLHDKNGQMMPEKRLEDLDVNRLTQYFQVNSLLPMLWLKYLLPLFPAESPSHFVCWSARVGSIADNRLGGWYGYRASKAALNMLIKSAQVEIGRRKPNLTLVCYHPGTVDSALSKPFQANVPKQQLLNAEFSGQQLLAVLPQLTTEQAPHFIDWQGKSIPW